MEAECNAQCKVQFDDIYESDMLCIRVTGGRCAADVMLLYFFLLPHWYESEEITGGFRGIRRRTVERRGGSERLLSKHVQQET